MSYRKAILDHGNSEQHQRLCAELKCLEHSIADGWDKYCICRTARTCVELTLHVLGYGRKDFRRKEIYEPGKPYPVPDESLGEWLYRIGRIVDSENAKFVKGPTVRELGLAPSGTVYCLITAGNNAAHAESNEDVINKVTIDSEQTVWRPVLKFLFNGLGVDFELSKPSSSPERTRLQEENAHLSDQIEEQQEEYNKVVKAVELKDREITRKTLEIQDLSQRSRSLTLFPAEKQAKSKSIEEARLLAAECIRQFQTDRTTPYAENILQAAQTTESTNIDLELELLAKEKKEAEQKYSDEVTQREQLEEQLASAHDERLRLLEQLDAQSGWGDQYLQFCDQSGVPDWNQLRESLDERIRGGAVPFQDYKFLRTVSDSLLGKQGMIYKARHKNGQTVAIKLPLRLDAGYHYEAAFYRKALKANQPIPGLIQPVPDGIAPPTTPGYIILQWEDGLRLDEWVHKHEGALRESGRLFAVALKHGEQILTTLQALWKEDLIFTDLHPGNIMMRPGDRPMLLDPGGLVAASSLPELKTMASLIAATDSSEELPDLFASKRKELASMYLAMTTDLILYIASGGKHDIFGSTDANSQFVDQSKERDGKIKDIVHDSEIFPQGKEYGDRIEPGRSSLDRLFQAWSNPQFREDECNSSTGLPRNWFRDYRSDLLSLIDPYKAFRPIQ